MHQFHYVRGKLFCEDVAIETLVKKFGTPLYVYSQQTVTDHFQKLDQALSRTAMDAPMDKLEGFREKGKLGEFKEGGE